MASDGQIAPSDLLPGSRFGTALDLASDTLIVASMPFAYEESVSIFHHIANAWVLEASLPEPPDSPGLFGNDVAVYGDVALVGAPGEIGGYSTPENRGVVYIYKREDGKWSPAGKLMPDDSRIGDNFGWAIDYDGATAVISASSFAYPELPDQVYIFMRSGDSWAQTDRLQPTYGDGVFDIASVSYDGERIALGSREDFYQDTPFLGLVFLLELQGSGWVQTQVLRPGDVQDQDGYTNSVALAGQEVLAAAIHKRKLNIGATGAVFAFSSLPEDGSLSFLPMSARPALTQMTNLITYQGQGAGGNWDILLATAAGLGRTNLTNSIESEYGPAWYPDGQRIAFTREGESQIFLMDHEGHLLPSLPLPDHSPISRLAWAPDGQQLAFTALSNAGTYQIYIINMDGFEVTQLTPHEEDSVGPAWSPDGRRIVYWHSNSLWMADLETNTHAPLAGSSGARSVQPDWSPDGTAILFTSFHSEWRESLYNIPASGGVSQLVVAAGQHGRWSPDGTQIVFMGVDWGIFRADSNGRNLIVIDPSRHALNPDWQP